MSAPPFARFLRRFGLTLAVGTAGGVLFWLFHLPAPWLSGALISIVVMLLMGAEPEMPGALRDFGMLLAGAVTGSAITPEMVEAVSRYPLSMALLALTTAAIVMAGRWILERMFGWDRANALLASMPGALSVVVAITAETRRDVMRVMAVQSLRMFVLVALLPSTVLLVVHEVPAKVPGVIGAGGFAVMMFLALMVSLAFQWLKVMAPFLLGGMAVAGLLHVTGAVHGPPPPVVANLAMLLVGIFAGSRLSGLSLDTLRGLLMPGLALFGATTAIAAAGGLAAAWFVGVPVAEALVAFAPGGLEAMVMLGIAMGLDPLYVTSHHVARFLMISASLPFLARTLIR